MKQVLVSRSGGGIPGLYAHSGIERALVESGVEPTANAGTSAGAIVAAWRAAGRSEADLDSLLQSLDDSDLRRERFAWQVRAPWIDWFLDPAPIRRLLRKHLPRTFSELQTPCRLYATDAQSFDSAEFHLGDLVEAVMASMSISGVFPWVRVDGRSYMDGGVRRNLPLPYGWQFFDELWLIIATGQRDQTREPSGMIGRLLNNVAALMEDQTIDVLETLGLNQGHLRIHGAARTMVGKTVVTAIRPRFDAPKGPLRVDHAIARQAYSHTQQALAWLDAPGDE